MLRGLHRCSECARPSSGAGAGELPCWPPPGRLLSGGGGEGGGRGGGFGTQRFCVPTMAQLDFLSCKLRFFPRWSLWSEGGGAGGFRGDPPRSFLVILKTPLPFAPPRALPDQWARPQILAEEDPISLISPQTVEGEGWSRDAAERRGRGGGVAQGGGGSEGRLTLPIANGSPTFVFSSKMTRKTHQNSGGVK